jgi:hypothetical protein
MVERRAYPVVLFAAVVLLGLVFAAVAGTAVIAVMVMASSGSGSGETPVEWNSQDFAAWPPADNPIADWDDFHQGDWSPAAEPAYAQESFLSGQFISGGSVSGDGNGAAGAVFTDGTSVSFGDGGPIYSYSTTSE